MELIIKLTKKVIQLWSVAKDVGCSKSAVSKIWNSYIQNGEMLEKGNIQVGQARCQSAKTEDVKEFVWKKKPYNKRDGETNGQKQESLFVTELLEYKAGGNGFFSIQKSQMLTITDS